jgi:hypothetical protein
MMATYHMPNAVRAAALALLLSAALGGCTSVIDQIPTSLGGLPEGVPQRPAAPPTYPAVHDMPAPREDVTLSPEERKRLQEDLKKSRDRHGPLTTETTGTARKP